MEQLATDQASRWAVAHGAEVRFIDLPASDRLGEHGTAIREGLKVIAGDDPIARDPISTLAMAADYGDGESWSANVIKENPASTPVFAAVADAMSALRSQAGPRPHAWRRGRRICALK